MLMTLFKIEVIVFYLPVTLPCGNRVLLASEENLLAFITFFLYGINLWNYAFHKAV